MSINFFEAKVACDFVVEKAVGNFLATPDVVDNQISRIIIRLFIYHKANMRRVATKVPCDDISGLIVACLC